MIFTYVAGAKGLLMLLPLMLIDAYVFGQGLLILLVFVFPKGICIRELPLYVCIMYLSVSVIFGLYSATEIIASPKNTTVFLNHEGMFTCEANGGDYTVWRLNGKRIADLSPDIEEDLNFAHDGSEGTGSGLFIMNIIARSMYNGTTVQCVTGDAGSMTVESEIVTMTIQGNQC